MTGQLKFHKKPVKYLQKDKLESYCCSYMEQAECCSKKDSGLTGMLNDKGETDKRGS